MKSICLFASYFDGREIPYYVTVYLKELKRQFAEVVFLCSQKELSAESYNFLKEENISFLIGENEGFDFGLWYLAFQQCGVASYEQVALVNDSCILFKSLDDFMHWAKSNPANVKGITRSEAIYPHLQSYFLLLDKKAVQLTEAYFKEHKVLKKISDVIETYEVGLSKYWQEQGLSISAFMDNNGYEGEFSPYYQCINYHLDNGIPTIKKKIIFSSYRKPELSTLARMNFNIDRRYYLDCISGNRTLIIDPERLRKEKGRMLLPDRFVYNCRRLFIRLLRPVYKTIKRT